MPRWTAISPSPSVSARAWHATTQRPAGSDASIVIGPAVPIGPVATGGGAPVGVFDGSCGAGAEEEQPASASVRARAARMRPRAYARTALAHGDAADQLLDRRELRVELALGEVDHGDD